MRYRGAVALVVAPMVLAGFGLVAIVVGHGTTGIALLVDEPHSCA
jgi:hypothetical protein